jgi:NAD(P)H dehydrogenase (quinone)
MHLVVLGHPTPHSFSDALADAYARGLDAAGAEVARLELRALEFDPHLRAGFKGGQPLEPDLRRAQELIERARHVAWFFPLWWGGPPALVKGFIDRTFLPGWAFAYQARSKLPKTLLKGRAARVVTTMDGPSLWYHVWLRSTLHASFVDATLRFVGFGPIASTTLYSQRYRTPGERAAFLAKLERLGRKDASKAAKLISL